MRKWMLCLCVNLLSPLLAMEAAAQQPAPASRFDEGNSFWYSYASYIAPLDEHMGDNLYNLSWGYSHFFRDGVSLNPELAGYYVDQSTDDTFALGFNLSLRAHFWHDQRWSFFGDVGAGIWQGLEQVPVGGTRFNFPLLGGMGATYALSERTELLMGVRFWHLSNAFIEGRGRNPSYDGMAGYVGVIWWR